MYFNNVETKPGIGYPKQWEDQEKYKGGWELKNGEIQLKSGSKMKRLMNIFHNPDQPTIDDYFEPWNYDYETLTNSPQRKHQPVARPKSAITGEFIDKIEWGKLGGRFSRRTYNRITRSECKENGRRN